MNERAVRIAAPLVWGVMFLASWEGFVRWRHIKALLLPAPSRIWTELRKNHSAIIDVTRNTATNAVIGLVAGVAMAIAVALLAERFGVLRSMITPMSAAMNTMPIVALGPIFYNLFGTTSAIPRRAVVAVVVFFPVFLNVVKGLTQIEPVHDELMRSYAAGDGAVLRHVRLPNALPFLMTGVRLAASLAVIAAVVVEYFGGLQNGLGSRVTSAMKSSANARAWAYIVGACALGIAFYCAALLLERLAMPWQARRRDP